jgi:hypothetical protein
MAELRKIGNIATLRFNPNRTNAAALAKAATEVGYPTAEPNGATP